jgi:hypothetical protein
MDNLYLDMNGIVHPCSHPEDRPPPETEEEMMLEIFKYTERVVNMVRPRKLLMIAVGMCFCGKSLTRSGAGGLLQISFYYFSSPAKSESLSSSLIFWVAQMVLRPVPK